jgi:hypothetical protein
MINQTGEWFDAWHVELFQAKGAAILYTKGCSKLNNGGVGYREKLSQRYSAQGADAALFQEAVAIRKRKTEDPNFKIYVIDGEDFTASDLAMNLLANAPSFGPIKEWEAFLDGGCVWAQDGVSGGGHPQVS